jgi:hypothetical protein
LPERSRGAQRCRSFPESDEEGVVIVGNGDSHLTQKIRRIAVVAQRDATQEPAFLALRLAAECLGSSTFE